MEGSTDFFLLCQPNCHKGFTFTTTKCSFQLTQCETSLRMKNFAVCRCKFANDFFCKVSTCGPLVHLQVILWKNVCCQLLCELFFQQGKFNWERTYKTWLGKSCLPAAIYTSLYPAFYASVNQYKFGQSHL